MALENQTVKKVCLHDLEINEENWQRFWGLVAINDKDKKEYLQSVLNDALVDILYKNPSLFRAYSYGS